jgi:SAM-dependent methyltransferase
MALGYEREYFIARQHGWTVSAEAVAGLMLSLFRIGSVLEVGCGTGNLLAAFRRGGVADVLGLDGPNVPRDLLCVADSLVQRWDLDQLAPLPRRFDLACSLEVAEHLPEERAADFVRLLTAAAPVVLFGAAIPGQGGPGHVNEQRQSWWAAKFAAQGYVAVDCVRPAIWQVPDVEWYYAQNILVYCQPGLVPPDHSPVASPLYLDLVDDRVAEPLRRGPDSIKGALRAGRRDLGALLRALKRRMMITSATPVPVHASVG